MIIEYAREEIASAPVQQFFPFKEGAVNRTLQRRRNPDTRAKRDTGQNWKLALIELALVI